MVNIYNIAEGVISIAAAIPIGRALKPILAFGRSREIAKLPKGLKDGTASAMKRGRQQVSAKYDALQGRLFGIQSWQAGVGTVLSVKGALDLGGRLHYELSGRRAV